MATGAKVFQQLITNHSLEVVILDSKYGIIAVEREWWPEIHSCKRRFPDLPVNGG